MRTRDELLASFANLGLSDEVATALLSIHEEVEAAYRADRDSWRARSVRLAALIREMDDCCYLGRAHERGCGQSATARCVACEAIEMTNATIERV